MAPNQRVLIVEDDADTQEIMALVLRDAGYEVLTASDERGGLDCITTHPDIDIILTDACLGDGGSGLCMIEDIRRHGSMAPIIVVSEDPAASCATLGEDAIFLLKPYGRKALLNAVAAAQAKVRQAAAFAGEAKSSSTGTASR